MRNAAIAVLFVSLLILGCPGPQPPPPQNNTTTVCPANCTLGCMPDNITCKTAVKLCENVTCNDTCYDKSVLNTNGLCDPNTGACVYKKMVCVFGCENGSCSGQPPCPNNCPFGCQPGTDVCITATCPASCAYGCIAGTLQCNSIPPSNGIRNGDFSQGYAGWNATGNAFGSAPTSISFVNSQRLYRNVPYSGCSCSYFASSYFPQMDKGAMGSLTSDSFFINKNYLEFLVVGDLSGMVYVDLLVNNTVVRHVEVDNSYPPFEKITWNVSHFAGQTGVIKVVDASDRASIDVTDFVLVDTPSLQAGEPYVDPYKNFSIVPPMNWLMVHPGSPDQVFFYGPNDNNFATHMLIISQGVSPNETTESYFAKGAGGLKLLSTNYSAVSESNISIGGVGAVQLEYTYLQGGIPLESREVFLVKNEVGYEISLTAAESSFNNYADDFNSSIETFKP